jgi:hypothetical protein
MQLASSIKQIEIKDKFLLFVSKLTTTPKRGEGPDDKQKNVMKLRRAKTQQHLSRYV